MSFLTVLLSGCASQPANPQDPYEAYNRKMFALNQELYTLAHPVLKGYETVVPGPVQSGIRNFRNNVWMVPTIGNDLLQANFRWAGEDTLRFLLNSTLGCLGLFDVASHVGLYQRDQSFGLTLARWGAVQSPYLILPVFGPTTGRGLLEIVPDNFMMPMTYASSASYWPYQVLSQTQRAADNLPKYEAVTQTAIDPYVAIRTAYLQNQALLVWQVRHENEPISDAPMLQTQDMESPELLAQNAPIPGEPIPGETSPSETMLSASHPDSAASHQAEPLLETQRSENVSSEALPVQTAHRSVGASQENHHGV